MVDDTPPLHKKRPTATLFQLEKKPPTAAVHGLTTTGKKTMGSGTHRFNQKHGERPRQPKKEVNGRFVSTESGQRRFSLQHKTCSQRYHELPPKKVNGNFALTRKGVNGFVSTKSKGRRPASFQPKDKGWQLFVSPKKKVNGTFCFNQQAPGQGPLRFNPK